MDPVALFLHSCRRSILLLRDPAIARRWHEPSVLPEWSVAGLAGHFARSIFNLERAARVPPPPDAQPLTVIDYYTLNEPQPADSDVGQRIRQLGDEEAAEGSAALADRFGDSIATLEHLTARGDLPEAVTLFGSPMLLTECATACLLELIVHADDLTVSVDAPMPGFDAEALDLVAVTLARIGVRRRGVLPVLRAFTRPERTVGAISVF